MESDGCKMSVLDGQGDDSALFTSPVNGVASFDATMASTAFDYENPLDADGDNTFEFDVRTVCPGNVASSETYYVNVTNTVFGFYGDATASITEDVAANMSVWSPTMMNDTANCAITAGDDAGNFDINARHAPSRSARPRLRPRDLSDHHPDGGRLNGRRPRIRHAGRRSQRD